MDCVMEIINDTGSYECTLRLCQLTIYSHHRMYCSRRLKRIRKSLGFTQNHRNRFQKKHITVDKITDIR